MDKPFKIYSDLIDGKALAQFYSAMKLDYVVQGALMPDAHAGYALPIGAVVATVGKIVPAWVGYDIGCGMCAIQTTFAKDDVQANAKAIFDQIYRDVPTGFAHNKHSLLWGLDSNVSYFVRKEIIDSGAPGKQVGTLGGGNHFIEIGYDEDDNVWIVVHSGSRNIGHKIATHYMKLASGDGKAREGHYALDEDSLMGLDYIKDLHFAQTFALSNRQEIIRRTAFAIGKVLEHEPGVFVGELINRNHNHAERRAMRDSSDVATGEYVWIHRKGATHAEKGMLGVIPGNMRDGSFIVRGKGNPESLYSSSHGAGRVLGRREAKESLSMTDFKESMLGIQARVEGATLDESPMAYKDIFKVMDDQWDLVEVLNHITPIINIKGN